MNTVLLAAALVAGREGHAEHVDRWHEASARSSADLRERPDILSPLDEAGLVRMRSATLRRLPRPPSAWSERIAAHDLRRAFTVAYQMEAFSLGALGRGHYGVSDLAVMDGGPYPTGLGPGLVRLVSAPYVKACIADSSRRLRAFTRGLRRVDPCQFDLDAETRKRRLEIPRWNAVGRVTLMSLVGAWGAIGDAEMESELARVVVESRTGEAGPALTASRVCSGVTWTRTLDPDGSMVVQAHGSSLPKRAHQAPWRYRLQAGVAPGVGAR